MKSIFTKPIGTLRELGASRVWIRDAVTILALALLALLALIAL